MIRKVKVSELTKRQRETISRVELLPDWPEMKAAIDAGIARQQALELPLTDTHKAKFGLEHPRTVSRFLQQYVSAIGRRYTVKRVERDGTTWYQVINYEPVTKARKG